MMADAFLFISKKIIISSVVQEQAWHHVNLVIAAEEEVRSLSNELKRIRNVLDDAENRRFNDRNINTWLWKLRRTSYEMDDILDHWNYAILKLDKGKHASPLKQKMYSFLPSSLSSYLCFHKNVVRLTIAKKILNVKAQLDEILEEKKKYGFKICEPTTDPLPGSWRDQSTSLVDLGEVHGRDVDGDTLVNKLTGGGGSQEESGIHVVSIVGVGGIGKTTLAQLVYNHSRVEASFDLRIWICVSDPFDLNGIAKGILERIEKGSSRDVDQLDDLCVRVKESILGKKFLLVLDDVWTEEYDKWEPLETLLKCGEAGSKILVTTRSSGVAIMMGTRDNDIFRPGVLSNEDCWLVLCRVARLERDGNEFEEIGRKIVQKCSGLPLAAKTLGGLLRSKRSLREWENVLNSEIWEMPTVEDKLFRPLLMSYKELSPTQKQCLSYCAIFPKDSVIFVEELIGNWMALGYLGTNSSDMELKGKECFEVLAMRSLFQDFGRRGLDEIISFKMHDIVHDFALFLRNSCKVATCGACDPLLVAIVNEFCSLSSKSESPLDICACLVRLKVLNLSHCGLQSVPNGMDNLIHLRWLNLEGNELSTEDLKIIFQLYFLQTLNLRDCKLEEISKEIEDLFELRHIDLSANKLKELPIEIGNLKQLRHLDLSRNEFSKELPSEIGKLILLQTLILPNWETPCQIPESLTQLSGVRELRGFKGGSGWNKLGLLKNLKQLGCLHITLDGMDLKSLVEDVREADLSKKTHIQSLEIEFEDNMEVEESSMIDVIDALAPHPNLRILQIWDYKGSKLPLWIVSPSNQLRNVFLGGCNLTSFPSLGKLEYLEKIIIHSNNALEFVGRELLGITTKSTSNFVAFPKLKKLKFESCPNWKEWEDITAEEEEESPGFQVMPCLTYLEITACPALTQLPHRLLRKASSLKMLDLRGCGKLSWRYANKDGPHWKFISQNNPRLQINIGY